MPANHFHKHCTRFIRAPFQAMATNERRLPLPQAGTEVTEWVAEKPPFGAFPALRPGCFTSPPPSWRAAGKATISRWTMWDMKRWSSNIVITCSGSCVVHLDEGLTQHRMAVACWPGGEEAHEKLQNRRCSKSPPRLHDTSSHFSSPSPFRGRRALGFGIPGLRDLLHPPQQLCLPRLLQQDRRLLARPKCGCVFC